MGTINKPISSNANTIGMSDLNENFSVFLFIILAPVILLLF
ncbi:hypothetical protein MGA447_1876 [Enterococcus faecalis]|nr:hypothetical protein ELS84_1081 [Enterococcus faecalis]OSH14375.1 hypothetical protein EFDM72_0680 [Enterococcus faecalis]OSH18653.1 hypothetical protein MGA447_1876 [Enterococcus faecalis]OSH31263.1 hypothetical protein EFQH95_0089 [Enterococcus faecalis]OSH35198.1 hypothetical protein XJ76305_1800 [Enterococcus faecalis]